jgi:hypothetical protein
VPFTAISAAVAIALLRIYARTVNNEQMAELAWRWFHIFHPVHIFLSAVVTTAMFYRHEKRLPKAIIIGLAGSLVICGVSDVLFPFLGGTIFGVEIDFHLCLIKHPELVLPFALFGIFLGLILSWKTYGRAQTIFPHSLHVLVSTMATLLYLATFGLTMPPIAGAFLIVFLSVIVPCCISDIIFPLFFSKNVEI